MKKINLESHINLNISADLICVGKYKLGVARKRRSLWSRVRHQLNITPQNSFSTFPTQPNIYPITNKQYLLIILFSSTIIFLSHFPVIFISALSPEKMVSPENNPNWMFDCGLLDDVPVPGGHLPSLEPRFQWPTNAFPDSTVLRFVFLHFLEKNDILFLKI